MQQESTIGKNTEVTEKLERPGIVYGLPDSPELRKMYRLDEVDQNGLMQDWEYAERTPRKKGHLEWRYFHIETEKLSIVFGFVTKNFILYKLQNWAPYFRIEIHPKNKRGSVKEVKFKPEEVSFSNKSLYIKVNGKVKKGKEWLKREILIEAINGNPGLVHSRVSLPEIGLEEMVVEHKGLVRPHRVKTGFYCGGSEFNDILAWLIPQPFSKVKGHMIWQKEKIDLSGDGYADMGAGTKPIGLFSYWIWLSCKLGQYMMLFGYNVGTRKYKDAVVQTMVLAQNDGTVISANADEWVLTRGDDPYSKETHNQRPKVYYIDGKVGKDKYLIKVEDIKTWLAVPTLKLLLDTENYPKILQKIFDFIAGLTWKIVGSYLRFGSKVSIYKNDTLVATEDNGINELFRFDGRYLADLPPKRS
ncbi:hypothetical protein JW796_02835 [Candidatus Dojkabacteria bacterium]|nr:hypothetical protein [Candidatus Dojkabacteria bacterium]